MNKLIIKRFGDNAFGADPLWIEKSKIINKTEPNPDGWETVTRKQQRVLLNAQSADYTLWYDSLEIFSGNLDHKTLVEEVLANPSECFRIYKYLSEDLVTPFINPYQKPSGIFYDKQLSPKLFGIRQFTSGLIDSVVWYVWDHANDIAVEEVLKVSIDWAYATDAISNLLMPAAKPIKHRTTSRQWIKEDGTYANDGSGTSVRYKEYKSSIQRSNEGRRRRNNIYDKAKYEYVEILVSEFYAGEVIASRIVAGELLQIVSSYISDYISSGTTTLLSAFSGINDAKFYLKTLIPDNAHTQSKHPNAIGLTMEDYLIEIFKGNM